MGPKKRRGRKQSLEDRTVTSGAIEAVNLVSGDYGASDFQTAPEVELDVAQVLLPVTNDRKLSSAVLVLENCLLSTSPQQPRNSLASPSATDEVRQPGRPGRKRGSLGIRRGVGRRAPTGEGREAILPGKSEEILKPRVGRKQKRGAVRRVPRGRVDAGSSVVMATVVVDDPSSDVDVESSAVESGPIRTEECPADGEMMPGAETFLEKRKRKRAFKKEKHMPKRRRKDDVVIEEDLEEIKVVDEEGDEEEGDSYATWMVSPLSGDEERMIFKRQRKISPPDSEAGGLPVMCLVPAPAGAVADSFGSIPDSESPVIDTVFVDPTEGDTHEDVDVEIICPNPDEPLNTSFTALTERKGRRKKKRESKIASEIESVCTDVVNAGGRGRKGRRLGRKNPGLREVEGSQEPGMSMGSRVTRSRRNENGGATEVRHSSADNQSLGSEEVVEEVPLLSPGSRVEVNSLEDQVQEISPYVSSLEEPIPQYITEVSEEQTERAGSLPNSVESEDCCSLETPKLDAASVLYYDADKTAENAVGDGANTNYPAVTCAPVACQPLEQGSPESIRDTGIASACSNLHSASAVCSSKSSSPPMPIEKADCVDDHNRECLSLVDPAQRNADDSTTLVVDWMDGESGTNDDIIRSFPVNEMTTEENGESPSRATRSVQLEKRAEESLNGGQTDPGRGNNSASMSMFSTEEKSGSNATAFDSPSLSLECYSEPTCEASAVPDPDQSSNSLAASKACGIKPGDMGSVPSNAVGSVPGTEEGKLGEHDVEGVDQNMEDSLFLSSSDVATRDRKPEAGVIGSGVGSGDDTGFVPLKKRRLRVADAEDDEKLGPEDATTRASEDAPNPVGPVPTDSAAMMTIEGLELVSPASEVLTVALPCSNLAPKANKYVGTHVLSPGDLAGAVLRASQLGARALGIFIKPQKTLNPPPLDPQEATKFKEALKEKGYSPHMVVPHGSYLLNCGATDAEHLSKSRESLVDDLRRCQMLGLPLFNFHPGSYSDSDTVEYCVLRVADSINYVHSKVADIITVIENMSGEDNSVGSTFEQLKQIIDGVVDKSRVGVCLDTCHAFAAGYDLRNEAGYRQLMEDFDSTIGRQFLKAVHINDSRGDLGSRVDHHASIGKGKIGLTCFQLIMSDRSLENIPLILETPIAGHKQEIELLYSFV